MTAHVIDNSGTRHGITAECDEDGCQNRIIIDGPGNAFLALEETAIRYGWLVTEEGWHCPQHLWVRRELAKQKG